MIICIDCGKWLVSSKSDCDCKAPHEVSPTEKAGLGGESEDN